MSENQAEYLGQVREENTYEIREESPHDYFCQIPNLVDEMNLTPYSYRLYGHLKRVTGESGKCWQSTSTLAKACNMSAGSISKAKEELENTFPPLIRIVSKERKEGGIYHEIVITDIWKINHDFGAGKPVHLVKAGLNSPDELARSPHETKNTPIKNTPDIGSNEPKIENMPIDWKLSHGVEITSADIDRIEDMKRKDVANQIGTGLGINARAGADLAYAFMTSRNITIPNIESKIKGQRKAVKEMLEMKVSPEHVRQAVEQLLSKNMTIVDLFSVSKTAIDLANKPEQVIEQERRL